MNGLTGHLAGRHLEVAALYHIGEQLVFIDRALLDRLAWRGGELGRLVERNGKQGILCGLTVQVNARCSWSCPSKKWRLQQGSNLRPLSSSNQALYHLSYESV